MNILWFTARNMADLCSTTQAALGEGLVARGHHVTIINSDDEKSHAAYSWSHVSISAEAMRGRKAHVLGKGMSQWLSNLEKKENTIAIVDWRVATKITKTLKSKSIPWILMDRSPPADRGLLAKFQWPVWKRAWKIVKKEEAALGCVVSKSHSNFVQSKARVFEKNIVEIPAGVDSNLFITGVKKEPLALIYHGRLDRHRGVLALPMLLEKLRQNDIDAKLLLIGEGDSFEGLQRMAGSRKDMEVIATLPQAKLAEKLSESHIGLLPMPNSKVWSLASPLKRSEYAASGLLIFGIDHLGHRFEGEVQPDWLYLVDQEDFHSKGVQWIQSLTHETILELSSDSRRYAEQNLGWEKSIQKLEQACFSCLS